MIGTCRRRKTASGVLPAAARKEEDTITELMEEHLDDLESIETPPHIEFEIGDSVVYPHHGAGKVLRKEVKEVLGESREYLTIKILHNDMTVMVPTENAALAGLRRVIDEETVQKVLAVLQDECSEMPKNWNRRFKHNRDKIKTGDIYELAEVVRNLAIREAEKGLSTGEKQMFTRAKKILASELMYALGMDEQEVDEHLYGLLLDHPWRRQRQRQWEGGRRREIGAGARRHGGCADRGRRTRRAPWVWPAQGARPALRAPDARMERRGAAGGAGGHADRGRPARRRARRRPGGHGAGLGRRCSARTRCATPWPPAATATP